MDPAHSTAIVTGAARRVGRQVAEALIARGWTVIAHVRRDEDQGPPGAITVAADLASDDCAERIVAAARGQPPLRLLVNGAARFVEDHVGAASAAEFDAHMAVNVRAPMLLIDAFAKAHGGGDALIVNIGDAKLAAPNPDYLSYTLSKQALAGLTELAARALAASGIRVNMIAPALMLPSGPQDEAQFQNVHALNPLARGVEVADLVAALDYLIASPTVTGEVMTIDGGQRFMQLARDVQFAKERE